MGEDRRKGYDHDADEHMFARADRVEVIDATGRAFVQHYHESGVTISIQDEGRTVKIFAGAPKERP